MPPYHVVQQGEHLSSIARSYGFSDFNTIWNDGQNAELRQKRKNPNVLFPNDRLFIPERTAKEESGSTEQKHVFKVKQSELKLVLVLENLYGKPMANVRCDLRVESEVHQLVTDGQGRLTQTIPATAENAQLTVTDRTTSVQDTTIPIKIGHLDPIDEVSGQRARLNNLGYHADAPAGKEQEAEAAFTSAVEEFQCDHGLTVDGRCGPLTQAKLKEAHGC